ncbi:MAG: alternative ribosome rescue aminoacyl-tRNA hydrolase ArfB [Lentisphaeria bacterium]|nr:alternative ribosome rescue aminoacyl-tRNA hydrolase ArfB [Lentisphaeria bacterium]
MKYVIPDNELVFEYSRASGPGGQHVNRVQTAVQLRFDARASNALPAAVKQRLMKLAGSRLTLDGCVLIQAQSHRSQLKNKEAAVARLQKLVDRAAVPPKKRRPTKPTKASKERRLKSKKVRGQVKKLRGDRDGGE